MRFISLLIGGLCLAVQARAIETGHAHGQAVVFCVPTFAQRARVLAIRSEREPLWRQGLGTNWPLTGAAALTLRRATACVPWLQPVFRTGALEAGQVAICVAAVPVVCAAAAGEKARAAIGRHKVSKHSQSSVSRWDVTVSPVMCGKNAGRGGACGLQ